MENLNIKELREYQNSPEYKLKNIREIIYDHRTAVRLYHSLGVVIYQNGSELNRMYKRELIDCYSLTDTININNYKLSRKDYTIYYRSNKEVIDRLTDEIRLNRKHRRTILKVIKTLKHDIKMVNNYKSVKNNR